MKKRLFLSLLISTVLIGGAASAIVLTSQKSVETKADDAVTYKMVTSIDTNKTYRFGIIQDDVTYFVKDQKSGNAIYLTSDSSLFADVKLEASGTDYKLKVGENYYSVIDGSLWKGNDTGTFTFDASSSSQYQYGLIGNYTDSTSGAAKQKPFLCSGTTTVMLYFYGTSYTTAHLYEVASEEGDTSYSATDFATEFLSTVTCTNGPRSYDWNTMKTKFENLSDADKETLRTSEAVEGSDAIKHCAKRYDLIVAKYSATDFPDYMGRGTSRSNSLFFKSLSDNKNVYTFVIIGSAIAAVTAIGALTLKKRKEN